MCIRVRESSAWLQLAVYLLVLVQEVHLGAGAGPAPDELALTDWARGWALALQAALPDRLHSEALPLEAHAYRRADAERWARAHLRARPLVGKSVPAANI